MTSIPRNILNIKNYSVITSKVLGQGSFGIVFKGTHGKENSVAAKRIDTRVHPKVLRQDYERLKELDHKNVMKVLDVEQVEDILWVFMPYCEFGDLNEYYRRRDVTLETGLIIMKQIMNGIKYLHERDIIHRDIKPGNILVASESPLVVKLTDFDVTKFLDPEIETSVMSSNVGTNAFKAPEFFLRNDRKKIQYHRNVDVYAAGLTFLAMLQHQKPSTMLIPHIETPKEDSELHVPIGQLVAERIRYKVSKRNIVHAGEKVSNPMHRAMRQVVKKMTCENPEDRLSASDFETFLPKLFPLGTKKSQIFGTNLVFAQSLIVTRDQVIVSGVEDMKYVIRVMDHSGHFIKDIPSLCTEQPVHSFSNFLLEHPCNQNCILETCLLCKVIRMYNIDTSIGKEIYTDCIPRIICEGPGESVLVWDVSGKVLQLKWNHNEEKLKLIKEYDTGNTGETPCLMCFDKETDLAVLSDENSTQAMRLRDGSVEILWKSVLRALAMTCDSNSRIFMCSDH